MAASSNTYDNSSASDNARAHFGPAYNGDHRTYVHQLNNNNGNISISYTADETITGLGRNRLLLEAAAEGQTPRVVALLKLKADVEFRDEQGLTALHHAVLSGHSDVFHVLLEHGADINARTAEMGSPLCLAALSGDLSIVKVLIEARAKVDLTGGLFGTALHCACYNGNVAVARALVERGALVDSKCSLDLKRLHRFCHRVQDGAAGASTASGKACSTLTETWSPLLLAAWQGSSDVLQLLLEAGCKVNNPCGVVGVNPLMIAAKCGNVTAGRILIKNNANVNACDRGQRTALHHASDYGQEAFVKLLLGGCEQLEALDDTCQTPILVAAAGSQTAIVRILANSGANLSSADCEGNTLLRFAMQKTNSELAQILADEATKRRGSWRSRLFLSSFDATTKDVFECIVSASEASSRQCMYPIHVAAKRGFADAIPVLHSLGAPVTDADGQTWTATHHAAQSGSLHAFRCVLELGAVLDAPTNEGETALAIASCAGHSKIVLEALKRGADPDVRNSVGLTPLHLAAASGHAETVRILASKTVNPSAKSNAGDSALHHASRGGHSFLFPVLLGKGLDPNLPNSTGRTALDDTLDAKTRAALLAYHQPGPTPQIPGPASVVHQQREPWVQSLLDAEQKFFVIWEVVLILVVLPAIIFTYTLRFSYMTIVGTGAATLNPAGTGRGRGGYVGMLRLVLEWLIDFWSFIIILVTPVAIEHRTLAITISLLMMLSVFLWLGLQCWAEQTGILALGHPYLVCGLICSSLLILIRALTSESKLISGHKITR